MGQVTTLQREDLNISGLMSVPRGAGYMGVFGSGQYKCFLQSGTFVVPNGISELRVRVVGAGGGGGGGGGTALGTAGGTSSFGALISATGGAGGLAETGSGTSAGGRGSGGDFQASGGSIATATNTGGGGGSGSQLGDGGTSIGSGGGGVNGGKGISSYGGSAFGNANNNAPAAGAFYTLPPSGSVVETTFLHKTGVPIRFPFEFFDGAGGSILTVSTGPAAAYSFNAPGGNGAGGGGGIPSGGGGIPSRSGGNGGIGGGGGGTTSQEGPGGCGGIGGGGGGNMGYGGAGGGYAHGVFTVTPGSSYVVTVGKYGVAPGMGNGGHGLVVVEW